MVIRVLYCIDAHEYDRRSCRCASYCRACALERRVYSSVDEAIGDQPAYEVARPDGNQSALELPVRRDGETGGLGLRRQ
jgi:hypothetical protein